MAIRQLNDGRWVCYYRDPGTKKTKFEYFGRGASGQAGAQARHNELNLKPRRPPMSHTGPLFFELAKEYVQNKIFNDNSQKMLTIRLSANIIPALGNVPAIQLTDNHLDTYVRTRRQRSVKYATIVRELNDIQAILNWSASRKPPLIPANPIKNYKKPKPEPASILPVSREETSRILSSAAPHLKRAILLSYYLGLRPGKVELLSLTWDHIDWEKKEILVQSASKGGPVKRFVPLHNELMPLLKQWFFRDKGKGNIIHIRGNSVSSIKKSWKGALKRAGIVRQIRPYDLRHAFITTALENNADYKTVSEIVGSRPETIMRHYQHVTTKQRRKTIDTIPGLEDI